VSNLQDPPPAVVDRDGVLELSAFAPLSQVIEACRGRLPGLAQAAALFGSPQIRNRATLGGNLANASPAADTVPPLVAAEASVAIEGSSGRRALPVIKLSTGPGVTVLGAEEWIAAVMVPVPPGREGFRKIGGRAGMAISLASLAFRWALDPDGVLHQVRLAMGAVAPTVIRAQEAESELEGRRPTAAVVDRSVRAVQAAVSPIDDARASAWYRREVVGNLLREALASSGEDFTLPGRTRSRD
jgi:CO/xanthine dehydrogenase FAD-binding subunit